MLCDWAVAGGEEEDVAMLVLEPSSASTVQPDQPSSSSFMGRVQQYVLGAFVSRVIIRWRIPVISEFLRVCVCVYMCVCHTPNITCRNLPPNSARFGYTTEGALFISAQLSTDMVSTLRKVWVLIRL